MKQIIKSIACAVCQALSDKPEDNPAQETFLPTSKKHISISQLYTFLQTKFPEAELFLSDSDYVLANYDDIARFLFEDASNKFPYQPEEMDCDDFALRLAGQFAIPGWSSLTLGLVWTDIHALNCVITESLEFYFVEPQTDELQSELKSWQGSKIRFIII